MLRRILLPVFVIACLTSSIRAAEPVTLSSLLKEMVDRDEIARSPVPHYRCLQASSYDRAQKDPNDPKTWFANRDYEQFIRTETNDGRKEWVIMEHSGPGAIVRFWAPVHPPTDNQVIRFYFDGAKTPAIAVKFNDLLRGKGFVRPPLAFVASDEKTVEGVAGDLYLPISFATGCKITLDSMPFYYNINYRAYDAGTDVKTFTMREYEAATDILKEAGDKMRPLDRSFITIEGNVLTQKLSKQFDHSFLNSGDRGTSQGLPPGKEVAIDLPAGSNAIRCLTVTIDPSDAPQVLRSLALEATFDGERCVCCPLGDFFGCGVRLNPVEDWQRLVAANGGLTASWVMPYQRSCRIAVKNIGTKSVAIAITAHYGTWHWDDRSMHFHATWRHQYPIQTKRADGTMDWNYLEATGKGVYVGDTLTVFSPVDAWYGEGDERVYVDGEKFPSQLGTGTEDYYGYAWGMAHEFSSPFLSMPPRDKTSRGDWRGYTTTSRMRLLDGVPFERSLKFDMEIWDWAATKLEYSAGTFWYARPGATSNRSPAPEEAASPILELPQKLKIAGAIECEQMKVIARSPGLPVETQADVLEWSGGKQLFVRGRRAGDFVELKIPATGSAVKKITLYATTSYDYGILRFSVNGQSAGKDYDAYSADSGLSGPIELGTFTPEDGQFILRVEVVGGNPAARGSKTFFGLDAVTLR